MSKDYFIVSPNINAQDKGGNTALMKAAYHGHIEVVKILLSRKELVEINKKDNNGITALMMAAASQ